MAEAGIPPPDSGGDPIKARSANIFADPKMKALTHYMDSHQHEIRLKEAAGIEKPAASSRSGLSTDIKALRAEGCKAMDLQMKKLSKGEPVLPYIAKSSSLPDRFRGTKHTITPTAQELKGSMEARLAELRRMDDFETRLNWRANMDGSLRRLLIDMDLSRDERLKEYEVKQSGTMQQALEARKEEKREQASRFAKARCAHLDHVYTWHETHGMKEARKERKAPDYLKYDPQKQVMPGSRRVAPLHALGGPNKSNKSQDGGMEHSSSSPALLSAGTAAAATPPPDAA